MPILFLGACLFVLAWLMPGHYLPWPSFQNQAMACLALLVLLVGAWRSAGLAALRWTAGPSLAFVALSLVPLLQWGFGRMPFLLDAVVPWALIVILAVAVVVGRALQQRWQDGFATGLFASLVVAAAASVALQWMQWQGIGGLGVLMVDQPPGGRLMGNLAQPNHLGTLLCLGVGGLIHLRHRGRLKGVAWAALLVWLLAGVVMTQSRTAWLQMGLLTAFAAAWHQRTAGRRVWVAYGLGYAAFLACAMAWLPLNDALLLMPPNAGLAERLHPGSRWEYWPVLAQAVLQHPWLGWGWNQVAPAQQYMGTLGPAGFELLGSAHNILLDLALQAGIPVAALVVWVVVRWGRRNAAFDANGLVVACAGVILLHALTEFPLESAHFLITLGLLMGMAGAGTAVASSTGAASRWPAAVFAASAVALAGVLSWIGLEYLQVEQADRDARMARAGIGVPPGTSVPAPALVLLDAQREFHRFRFTQARPGMSGQELAWMRQVARRYPFPPASLRLALAAGLNGRPAEAQATLRALCHTNAPARCDEAQTAWAAARQRHAGLPEFPAVQSAPAWWRERVAPPGAVPMAGLKSAAAATALH